MTEEASAKIALEDYLADAANYQYSTATNWLDINNLTVAGKKVSGDFSETNPNVETGIKNIYNKLVNDGKISDGKVTGADGSEKNAEEYAIDSYVMNTLARYLGALHRQDAGGTVAKINFGGVDYTWNGTAQGSNWKAADGSTLVSVVVTQQNTSIRNVTLTLIDAKGYSVEVNFVAENVPGQGDISFDV